MKKKIHVQIRSITALLLICSITFATQAQTKSTQKSNVAPKDAPVKVASQPAAFPGGVHAFYTFLARNIKYPRLVKEKKAQGKVYLTFVVEKDGRLNDIKILRGIGYGCDEEAIRVMKTSPRWSPGRQHGKLVRQQYTVPIKFSLQS